MQPRQLPLRRPNRKSAPVEGIQPAGTPLRADPLPPIQAVEAQQGPIPTASISTAPMPLAEWSLTIGEIVAPFGLAGEMKVRLETDFPERFKKLKQVCVRAQDGQARMYDVESTRLHKEHILLRLKGVADIDEAIALRNHFLQVRAQDAVRLPKDEFYIHDLLGCEVVMEDGRVLGQLMNILRGGGNDVYVIGQGKDEILLPAIKDVVRSVDLAQRRIVVSPTPGLMPDDETEEA